MRPRNLVKNRPAAGIVEVADPALSSCACAVSAVWTRLSGAARFSATKPVTGGRPKGGTTSGAETDRRAAAGNWLEPADPGFGSWFGAGARS
jgi:hypothetical protein